MRASLALCMALAILVAVAAEAQPDYRFAVPSLGLDVYVNPDASVTLDYTVTFQCSPGARPIDIVDMGLPHKGYHISNMTASLDDRRLSGIAKSTAIPCGVEVPLGSYAIQPGQRGVFRFRCTMPDMVYQDTTRKDYASLWITPTWWGPQYVDGLSKVGVLIYLPKEIKPEEVLHQGDPFSLKATKDEYTLVAWFMDPVRVDQPHLCKLSFPKRTMDRVVTMTVWKLFRKWWVEHRQVRIGWACVVFILLGIIFFRATRGTGISIYIFLLAALGLGFYESPIFELVALPALLPLGILAEKARRRARGHYLPAIASVEAGGVKRGLTAPEAAIILELPLARVLTLIIFGLLKKGILKQIEAEPLEVQVAPEYASLAPKDRAKKAQAAGTVLHAYEQPFLDEIEAHPGHPLNRLSFAAALKAAIESTAKRMKGFDLERSRGYYRYIVSRAWAEARAIGDIEQRTEYTDDNLLWLLAADNGYDSFDYWWRSGYHYHAPWSRGTPMGGGLPTPGTPVGGTTSFRDVAQSFSGWAENVTGGLAGHLDPISVGVKDRGILDLSGADKVTVDMLETLAKSSGGGGGGGGCACAGCACACACAGGGR